MMPIHSIRNAAGAALLALSQLTAGPCAAVGRGDDAQATTNADIYGRWKITKVLDYAAITDLDERQARRLVGKTMLISQKAFAFNGEVCEAPSYERSVEETARKLREYGHVSSVHMGLPDPVTVVDAGCTDLYLKSPGVMVVQWGGVYFDVVRTQR